MDAFHRLYHWVLELDLDSVGWPVESSEAFVPQGEVSLEYGWIKALGAAWPEYDASIGLREGEMRLKQLDRVPDPLLICDDHALEYVVVLDDECVCLFEWGAELWAERNDAVLA